MKKFLIILPALLLLFFQTFAQTSSNDVSRPKLVVGIVVDQMRWDYLYRFYSRYENGGFKRLLNEGFSCENTYINYVPTVTAIGHASVYTGSVPAIHGITGNDFIIQKTGKSMYCTGDSTVTTLGSNSTAGKMSPRNLMASTITDELKLATNFRSKVIGVSVKDRGGILPAGHAANAAFWFDDASGNMISSTYYMKDLPNWVKEFNKRGLAAKFLNEKWNTLYPLNSYLQSSADNNPYEGSYKKQKSPVFPHDLPALKGDNFGILRSTPFGNTLTVEFAKESIANEGLGTDDITDFLTISFSATDYIGHQFGPNSVEIEDTYLRLDRELAGFFKHLDAKVGKGKYTVFLTADHAVAHNAGFLTDNNIPSGLWNGRAALTELNKILEAKYGVQKLALSVALYQVSLNNVAIAVNKLDESAIIKDCVDFLSKEEEIAYVVPMKDVANATVPAEIKERIQNGYNAERSGAIQIILKPGYYNGGKTGASHSAWNPYDAHIPLLWMGWGIKQGRSNQITHITDISATLAALLRIQAPNGCIGKPITEVLDSKK